MIYKMMICLALTSLMLLAENDEKASPNKTKDNSAEMFSAQVTLLHVNGKVLAGEKLTVLFLDRKTKKREILFEAKTDSKGILNIDSKLKAGVESYFCLRGPDGIDGWVQLSTIGVKPGDMIKKTIYVGPKNAPDKGDDATDFDMIDIKTGKTVKLSSYKGQVIYMDFWATWCGPCQGPMKKNNEWMKKNAVAWKDKAVIIGIGSGDKDMKVLKKHINKRGWDAVHQYWIKAGSNSIAYKAYKVDGYPTALLIDQQGKIVWRGHPGNHNGEKHINELLGLDKVK